MATKSNHVTPRMVIVLLISIFIMFESYRVVDFIHGYYPLNENLMSVLKLILGGMALPFFMVFASNKKDREDG